MSRLDEIDIKFLTGVGPKRAELLAEQLHIRTFYDLLYYFPFRYVDRSRIFQIRELESGMPFIQLKGRFVTMTTVGEGAKRAECRHCFPTAPAPSTWCGSTA